MLVNDGNDSDIVERTLCQLPFVHVFRIPVRKSSGKSEYYNNNNVKNYNKNDNKK